MTAAFMRLNRPRDAIAAYVRARLLRECATRGTAARIARYTGISTAHITNMKKADRGVGDDAARALATYWGLSFAELEAEAVKAAPPVKRPPTRPLPPLVLTVRVTADRRQWTRESVVERMREDGWTVEEVEDA